MGWGCNSGWPGDDYGYDDDAGPWGYEYKDPPLYPAGKLAGMTVAQLEAERDRQNGRQGRLGDAEHIDDRAVEETEQRARLVEAELKRRAA